MQLILVGQKDNFRSVLKSGSQEQIQKQKLDLNLILLFLANTYTGANFKNPPTQEQQATIQACSNFIIEMFPMLSIKELELAFKMASAGKFEIDTATYYGKFSVQYLGKLLKAYLKYRKNLLFIYSEEEKKEQKRIKEEEKKKQNDQARKEIIQRYLELKNQYQKGNFIEIDILPVWATFLRNQGLISFTFEQELEIETEARKATLQEMKRSLTDAKSMNPFETRTLIASIKKIELGEKTESFEAKAFLKYKELLIKKSLML